MKISDVRGRFVAPGKAGPKGLERTIENNDK